MPLDMKERKCGCITYEYGPPLKCPKHAEKDQAAEEKGLRKVVRETADHNGHRLTLFTEYESVPGKWTAFCEDCGKICIVYDQPPVLGDQVAGRPLTEQCTKGVTDGWGSTARTS